MVHFPHIIKLLYFINVKSLIVDKKEKNVKSILAVLDFTSPQQDLQLVSPLCSLITFVILSPPDPSCLPWSYLPSSANCHLKLANIKQF